jgi:DNA polymerase-4
MPVEVLEKEFGKQGLKMHQLAMGIDERDVEPYKDAKSIGHEMTFSRDILDVDTAKRELLALADRVAHRMRRDQVEGRTITLKVKYSDFTLITRAASLSRATDDGSEIYLEACKLLEKTAVGKRPVRLLGISLSRLTFVGSGTQMSLFDENKEAKKKKDLHKALDSLYEKHGQKSILPGTLIENE